MFVKKNDESFRMFIVSGAEKLAIKNSYPHPKIDHLFDQLHRSNYYLEIYLRSDSHQQRVLEEDVPTTTFRPQYGHYEFLFMSFGLTNAPTIFIDLMKRFYK